MYDIHLSYLLWSCLVENVFTVYRGKVCVVKQKSIEYGRSDCIKYYNWPIFTRYTMGTYRLDTPITVLTSHSEDYEPTGVCL